MPAGWLKARRHRFEAGLKAEYSGSGTLLRRYIPGPGVDQRVAMVECGSGAGAAACVPGGSGVATRHYFADRQGDVLVVSNGEGRPREAKRGRTERHARLVVSASSRLCRCGRRGQQFFYTPFGVELVGNTADNPFRYTGRRYDPETGLYYYRARYYDADLGRFLQVDPIGYADQWNLYAYVGNNPLNATDPSGRESYIVGRRIFSNEQAVEFARIASTAAGGSVQNRMAAGLAAYNTAIDIKHALLVVTAGGTTLADGAIEATYSYGPENENQSASAPFGQTVLQGPGTDTFRDDVEALQSIISGEPNDGVSYQQIGGVSNADAHRIFSAPSDPAAYNPVPATVPGTTNSNSEAFARGEAGAAAGGSTLQEPSGIFPGAGQAERVTCSGSRIQRVSC